MRIRSCSCLCSSPSAELFHSPVLCRRVEAKLPPGKERQRQRRHPNELDVEPRLEGDGHHVVHHALRVHHDGGVADSDDRDLRDIRGDDGVVQLLADHYILPGLYLYVTCTICDFPPAM